MPDTDKTIVESVVATVGPPPGSSSGAKVITAVKAGWRTTEFWLVLGTIIAAVSDAVAKYRSEHIEPTNWGILAAGAAAGLYAIARAVTKTKA